MRNLENLEVKMENKDKGWFTGFGSVFSFTAEQNMKGKGFVLSSIIIGLLMMAAGIVIPVIMAYSQKSDYKESGGDNYNIENNIGDVDEAERMDAIVAVNEAGIEKDVLEGFLTLCGYENVKVEYTDKISGSDYQEFFEYCREKYERPVGIYIHTKDGALTFSYYIFEETGVSKDFISGFAESLQIFYKDIEYLEVGISEQDIELLSVPAWTSSGNADGEKQEFGVIIAQTVVPAIFSMLLFMMTVMYGQSITKVVMSEKSSKLMEVLLTSVKPYALISGKIAAMAVIAIAQMGIWIVLAIIGFVIGDKIGANIYADYQNYVTIIIDIIRESGTGFSVPALLFSVLMTVLGFFMYCVWAGFIASAVDKVDDVSTAMSLFQIPVILGFLISYMGSIMGLDTLITLSEYIAVVSPFVMPADLLMGKASLVGGIVSFFILAVFTLAMVWITGKVYKGKVFNRK